MPIRLICRSGTTVVFRTVRLEPYNRSLIPILQGEVCVAGSRVYVQEGIYDEVVKKLTEKAKNWVVGDPFDPKSQLGPQVIV